MFTQIDMQKWPRGQMFYYFSKMAPTGYSITVKVDVTKFYESIKKNNLKFFAAYLWIVTKNINNQMEFKCAVQNEKLGYFDKLTPLYANFHDDDKTISLMWTEYNDSFMEFHKTYLENKEKFGNQHGILSQPDTLPPPNAYTVSCVPWINFEHFSLMSYENKPYYFPSIEAGKFYDEGNKKLMPLSITVHHATTDGYHINKFLEELQKDMDNFNSFIN